jgi:hypothetical protein
MKANLGIDDSNGLSAPTAWGRFFPQLPAKLGETGWRFYVAYRT